MSNRLVRSLVLGCGLLLALPPGWCCAQSIAAPKAASAAEKAPKAHRCVCCPAAPVPEDDPAPVPPAPQSEQCDCDREYVETSASPVVSVDVTGVLLPNLSAGVAVSEGLPQAAADGPTTPPPSLQLLHCVWLC